MMSVMWIALPLHYLWWHYTASWRALIVIHENILIAVERFFSLGTLVRTLFSPWRRLADQYPANSWQLGEMAGTFVLNTVMRVVGLVIRLSLLVVGVVAWLAVFVLGLLVYPLWFFLPFVVGYFLYQSVVLMMR